MQLGQEKSRSLKPALCGVVFVAAVPAVTCGILICAVFVLGNWRVGEKFPELKKLHGKDMYIDLLVKIKNAQAAGKKSLKTRYIKTDYAVAGLLQSFGFLRKVEVKGKSFKKIIEIHMNPERPIRGLKFLSRPSMRRYVGYRDFRKVKGGYGLLVVSTPKGILAGGQAKKEKTGGQLLFEIW